MKTDKPQTNQFLETTIENWLSTVNELGYQLPFCQLLLQDGYSVCHNSKQNAFEQGKDIIAINSRRVPVGFQLKGGNITNARWRDEVYEEIRELVEYPIIHPSIKKGESHISYLVTNGEIEDTVRRAIDDLNSTRWAKSPLQVIVKGSLLKSFLEISSRFIPSDIADYKTFLELYFADGSELIDESKYCNFITEVLRLNEAKLSKAERKRNIAASVLFTSYIISTFKRSDNHVSILQTLSLLSGYVFALVEKNRLTPAYWKDSFDIIWEEMMGTGKRLQEEIDADGLKKSVRSIWDGELGKYRKHLAVSYLFAYKVAQLIRGEGSWNDILSEDFMGKLNQSLYIWGEGAFPTLFLFYFHMAKNQPLPARPANKLLHLAIDTLIKEQGRKSKEGLLSPYYGIVTAAKQEFGLLEEPIDETFVCRSHMLWPVIEMLARTGDRGTIERNWREITYIIFTEFTPEKLWMHFLWRSESGEMRDWFPKQTQSWNDLVKDSSQIDLGKVPVVLRGQSAFLPFFLLVYPHRVTANYIKFLDETINRA